MNVLFCVLLIGAVAPPYQPMAPRYVAPVAPHVDQPVVKAEPMIQGVPYLRRLPGPANWFSCPSCGSSTDLMFLGEHLRGHGVSNADLNRAGYQRWTVMHDNLHNKTWKATPKTTVQQSGCADGSCSRPIRSFLFRR